MDSFFEKKMLDALNRRRYARSKIETLDDYVELQGINIAKVKEDEIVEEGEIRQAIEKCENSNILNDNYLKKCWQEIAGEYEVKKIISVKKDFEPYEIERKTSDKDISFIVHAGKFIFNGKNANNWIENDIKENSKISLYFKNLSNQLINFNELTSIVGYPDAQLELNEIGKKVTEAYIVNLKDGIHMSPACDLVEALTPYKGKIIIEKKDGPKISYEGNSLLSLVMLGATYNSLLKFTYDISTKELKEQFEIVSPKVKEILSKE